MEEAWNLWKIRRTVFEMLRDRGFEIKDKIDLNLLDFKKKYCLHSQEDLDLKESEYVIERGKLNVKKQNLKTEKSVLVLFPKETSIRVSEIKEFYQRLQEEKCRHLIIILRREKYKTTSTITPQGKRAIYSMESNNYNVETFYEKELIVNITKHMLVPIHMILSDEDKKELLSKYKLQESQVPRIRKNDPIARYFGVKRRQILRIIRNSKTSGKYVTYRIVV